MTSTVTIAPGRDRLVQRFRTVAVLNRGEAAVRFLTAAAEWRAQRGWDLETILFHTDADADTLAVQLADVLVPIGRGASAWNAYNDVGLLLDQLAACGAEAVWLGWGFLSESADFVQALEDGGFIPLAPPAEAIRRLGDKVEARIIARSLDVPTIAGSGGAVQTLEEAHLVSAAVGYPVMVKASGGGGGRGIRMADDADGLEAAFLAARREGEATSRHSTVFVEHFVARAKHIEAQVVADEHGGVRVLGFRDCSVQRRRQKVVEESATLEAAVTERLAGDARRLCAAVDYRGVGTVEFLVDGAGRHYFLEVNPRLQVEHPVTELTSGLDIVKLQLDIASGGHVPPEPVHRGHAIEVRLNAEDTKNDFAPNAGKIVTWRVPHGPGIRVDTGFELGSVVPPFYDSMVAKVLVWGADRGEAIARLHRALADCRLLLESGTSNRSLLDAIARSADFVAGRTDTTWLDRILPALNELDERSRTWCLLVAAVEIAERQIAGEEQRFASSARRGRPPADLPGSHTVTFRYGAATYELLATALSDRRFQIDEVEVETWRRDDGRRVVAVGGETFVADTLWTAGSILVECDAGAVRCLLDAPGRIQAFGTGVVVGVTVAPGRRVERGETIAVLEAMKMETRVVSPIDGVVRAVLVDIGQPVSAGDLLAIVDEADTDADERGVGHLTGLPSAPPPASWSVDRLRDRTIEYILGYELAPGGHKAVLNLWSTPPSGRPGIAAGRAVLEVVVDVVTLGRRTPEWDVDRRANFENLLLALPIDRSGWSSLPTPFVDRLERVLSMLGDRGAEAGLDPLLYRAWRAVLLHQRALDVAVAIVASWSQTSGRPDADDAMQVDVLSRLALATYDEAPRLAELAHLERDRILERQRDDDHAGEVLPDLARRMGDPAARLAYAELLYGRAIEVETTANVSHIRCAGDRHVVLAAVRGLTLDAATGAVVRAWAAPDRTLELVAIEPQGPDGRPEVVLPDDEVAAWSSVRATIVVANGGLQLRTVEARDGTAESERTLVHPELATRLELWRYRDFTLARLPSTDDVFLFDARARTEAADHRLIALGLAERLAGPGREAGQRTVLHDAFVAATSEMRSRLAAYPPADRPTWNRIVLYVDEPWTVPDDAVRSLAHDLEPSTRGLDLEKVLLRVRISEPPFTDLVIHVASPNRAGISVGKSLPSRHPVRVLTAYGLRVARLERRDLRDPYEIVRRLTNPEATAADFPVGSFVEYDLEGDGELREVHRPKGMNEAGIVVGVIQNVTAQHPEGMRRVFLASDPSRRLGSLAEPECRRIVAALDLAERLGCPVEWFTVSAGARISMDSGTENMDWIARVLRRIIGFTQAGGEINVVVAGVNVGAQPYFNAEATMLMHTRGILIMTGGSSMVLTGKDALDVSGGVSGRDNVEIGGFPGVMGPNGQAQFLARTLGSAFEILFRWYELTYVAPGEDRPRDVPTRDPVTRDVTRSPHPAIEGGPTSNVGEIFSAELNAERKRPFDIRSIMRAVVDHDHAVLERWVGYGEGVVTWEARIGGMASCVIGIESHNLPRPDAPADVPPVWSAGTLFPDGAKKLARAINSASGRRPLVVLANLAGFDGSPASLRELQLEYGAEIGRAVVNCRSPIVFCVTTRYHGGAFVVFSKYLNDRMDVIAIEGAKASVIGGTPAAAVVLAAEVRRRALEDLDVKELERRLESVAGTEVRNEVRRTLDIARREAYQRHLSAVAAEFDATHSIDRAVAVGSVDEVIAASELRPAIAGLLAARRSG